MMKNDEKQEKTFEQSFARLEEILGKISKGTLPLEKSLSLYEEAESLVSICSSQLQMAEKKIQILLKNRENGLALDDEGNPQLEPFEES